MRIGFIRGTPFRAHHIIRFAHAVLLLTIAASPSCLSAWDLKDAKRALDQGRYTDAERLARQEAHGDTEAQAYNLIGAAQLYQGEYEAALKAFDHSRALHQARGEFSQQAEREVNIGAIHFYQGRYLDAWESYGRAMSIVDQHWKANWADDVRRFVESNQAALLQKLGRDQDALTLYAKLRQGSAKTPQNEQAQVLSNLGALYRRLGDPWKAIAVERQAVALFRQAHDLDGELGAMKNLAITQALEFGELTAARNGLQAALALAVRSGNRREELQVRLYLAETIMREGDRAGAVREWTSARAIAHEVKAPEEEWKALYGLGLVQNDRELWKQAAALIESGRAGLRSSPLRSGFLADKRDVYDALVESANSLDERLNWLERSRARTLQDTLPSHGGLRISGLQAQLPEDAAMLIYWVTRDKAGVLWISKRAAGWSAIPWTHRDGSEALHGWRSDPRAWGNRLLAAVPAAPKWIIVPDGILAGVPFDALVLSDGARVIQKRETWILPSAGFLTVHRASRKHQWPWDPELLAIGDPPVASLLPGDARWRGLPRASAEMRAAASQLNGRADIWLGSAASKNLLANASQYRVLHLATHAVADFENAARSRILFAGPRYLFLRDVAQLNLNRVDLVTLSACETEAGPYLAGEGPLSFGSAFLEAGAASTVGTLWAVTDEAAARFTRVFYHYLGSGHTRSSALRAAKLDMLHSGLPPEDWAAFILTGDGDTPLTPVISWSTLLLACAAVLIVAGLAAMWRSPAQSAPRVPHSGSR